MLKSCMKVSAIVPAYNEEKYIKACLEALTNQELKADEIIVVDNNCTDNTVKIAKEYNATIVQEKKQGLIYARNKGFDAASYDIIARCDADCHPPQDWIEKIRQNFESSRINALTGPVVFYDLPFISTIYARIYLFFMKLIFTKKIWEQVKNKVCLNDKKVHEDIDLGIHIVKIGGIIGLDSSLIMQVSGRRIPSNPLSFFIEYPVRLVKTLLTHK